MLATGALAQESGSAPLQLALERMLSERESPEALARSIEAARQLGAGDQAILEARFLYHVDRREDDKLAAMLPDFLAQKDRFKISESEIFAVEEDFLAVVEYVHAIAALRKDDREGFKRHITEAFWLSPRQGAAFAPHIERLRLEEAMRNVKVDDTLPLRDLDGTTTDLRTLRGANKAVLLHFFSPWSRECEASMPDFIATRRELASKGIAVVTVLGESGNEVVAETRGLLAQHPDSDTSAWVIDNPDSPLNRTLRVQSVPVMVLVSQDGKMLFNGHPTEDELWQELRRVAPDAKRPPLGGDGH